MYNYTKIIQKELHKNIDNLMRAVSPPVTGDIIILAISTSNYPTVPSVNKKKQRMQQLTVIHYICSHCN